MSRYHHTLGREDAALLTAYEAELQREGLDVTRAGAAATLAAIDAAEQELLQAGTHPDVARSWAAAMQEAP